MAISFVGSATGTTSATLPTHQVGDLIIAFAFRDGSTTIPTLGSGFTSKTTRTGTLSACRVGFQRATSTNTSSGTWTNATSVIFVIYRNVSSLGSVANSIGTSTTITFPGFSLVNTTGSSWIVGFVGSSSTNVAIETAPSEMINRVSVSDSTDEAAAHDTNSGLSSFTSRTASIGGSSGNWISSTIELIDGSATVSLTGFELTAIQSSLLEFVNGTATIALTGFELKSIENLLPKEPNWYSWFFEEKIIYAIGEQSSEIQVDGILLNSDFSELLFDASSNFAIDGIETFTTQGNVSITISDSEIVNGVEAISFAGQATVTADAYFEQFGLYAETSITEISIIADSCYVVSGNQAVSEFGEVSAFSDEQSNVSVELDGIATTASLGNVSAISESPETWSSGQIKRYPANQFVNAIARLTFIQSNATAGNVYASGTNVISIIVSVNSMGLFTEFEPVMADGVLSVSDEELIVLLAA